MTTEEPSLPVLLQRLHAELEHGPPLDPASRDLLRTVLDDIRSALDRTEPPPTRAEHESLAGRLRDATGHLEETHPRLTATVAQIIDALSAIFK